MDFFNLEKLLAQAGSAIICGRRGFGIGRRSGASGVGDAFLCGLDVSTAYPGKSVWIHEGGLEAIAIVDAKSAQDRVDMIGSPGGPEDRRRARSRRGVQTVGFSAAGDPQTARSLFKALADAETGGPSMMSCATASTRIVAKFPAGARDDGPRRNHNFKATLSYHNSTNHVQIMCLAAIEDARVSQVSEVEQNCADKVRGGSPSKMDMPSGREHLGKGAMQIGVAKQEETGCAEIERPEIADQDPAHQEATVHAAVVKQRGGAMNNLAQTRALATPMPMDHSAISIPERSLAASAAARARAQPASMTVFNFSRRVDEAKTGLNAGVAADSTSEDHSAIFTSHERRPRAAPAAAVTGAWALDGNGRQRAFCLVPLRRSPPRRAAEPAPQTSLAQMACPEVGPRGGPGGALRASGWRTWGRTWAACRTWRTTLRHWGAPGDQEGTGRSWIAGPEEHGWAPRASPRGSHVVHSAASVQDMDRQTELSPRGTGRRFLLSMEFQAFMTVVILVDIGAFVVEEVRARRGQEVPTWALCINTATLVLYSMEISGKMICFGLRGFFRDLWNVFDLIIVVVSAAYIGPGPGGELVAARMTKVVFRFVRGWLFTMRIVLRLRPLSQAAKHKVSTNKMRYVDVDNNFDLDLTYPIAI
ncbi:unnamed protein product [Prorocentrum cordatum]|uniref:Ion transport domain-containing protein n=1 Tax=Prorocentrum cordatum TaxID=2364126 RepID=A0ABN9TE76_9DINO|nr:unnamed protein product [Polarella glacialis]